MIEKFTATNCDAQPVQAGSGDQRSAAPAKVERVAGQPPRNLWLVHAARALSFSENPNAQTLPHIPKGFKLVSQLPAAHHVDSLDALLLGYLHPGK